MNQVTGIFRRAGPDHPWTRLMKQGTARDLWAYQQMYPRHEVVMFQYDALDAERPFSQWAAKRMKRV